MIDIHCHILPNVDDGAADLQTATMMAALAADDGVRSIIATPHLLWRDGQLQYAFAFVRQAAERFTQELQRAGIPVTCYPGAELLCAGTPHVPEDLEHFPTLAGSDRVLVEFFFDEKPARMNEYLQCLRSAGLVPVIAHPERYDAVQKGKHLAQQWLEQGCLLQVNKGSPLGHFGRRAQKAADRLLKTRAVAFLASDAHDIRDRTPRLKAARAQLSASYGADYLQELTEINPGKLLP